MSEHDQSRKFADKSATIANKTLQKGKAAVEQSAQAIEQSYAATVEKMRDYNLKMIDMAQANTAAVFEFARLLSAAKSSFELVELWTTHTRKQLHMLNEQITELTALGRKFAGAEYPLPKSKLGTSPTAISSDGRASTRACGTARGTAVAQYVGK